MPTTARVVRALAALALLGAGLAAPLDHVRGGVSRAETGRQAQDDIDNYFAQQTDRNIIRSMEDYKADHADELEFNHLPCHGGAGEPFKLACQSVSFHMRNRGRVVARGARGGGGKAQRQQKKDQQLFSESFIPEQSRHLDVQADSTFAAEADKTFDLHYADGSHLRGFTGKSVVALGDYEAEAPFGVITDCNSPDFNGVDGILGFGLPHRSRNMPRPILFAVTDANPDLPLKFSFYSTDDDAEVVLGGYDPSSVSEAMWYIPAMATNDFIVGVTSLRFGTSKAQAVELLKFKTAAGKRLGVPAILDSGTSCLVIPGDHAGGALSNVPWDDFARNWKKHRSFFLEIGQKTWEIPFSSWYLAPTEQTCVQPAPEGMQGMLVGDVFFREYVVEFDMTEKRPILGIAPLNKFYKPAQTNSKVEVDSFIAPKSKLSVVKGAQVMFPAEHEDRLAAVDRIPIENSMGTQYFMDVGVGTPRQKFTVIFDTGSTVFGVFTYKHKLPAEVKKALPGYYFSQDLRQRQAPVEALQVAARSGVHAGVAGRMAGVPGYVMLAAGNGLMAMAVVVLVVRRRRLRHHLPDHTPETRPLL